MTQLRFKAWRGKWAEKEQAFGYICLQLANWYVEQSKIKPEEFNQKNDLSVLKVMKLLFFIVSTSPELLEVFNNWWAVPYGHEEADVKKILLEQKVEYEGKTYHSILSGKILIGTGKMIINPDFLPQKP
jgi:hypothetical protein